MNRNNTIKLVTFLAILGTGNAKENASQLQYDCIMVISKYLNTIDDFINLEKTCKEFNGIMGQFRFNPISLTRDKIRNCFPNIQTQHLYGENEKKYKDQRIERYRVWHTISYTTWVNDSDKEITTYYDIEYGSADVKKYSYEIPEEATSIGMQCFQNCKYLESMTFPSSINSIHKLCFFI